MFQLKTAILNMSGLINFYSRAAIANNAGRNGHPWRTPRVSRALA
jgi:hypothetical protein